MCEHFPASSFWVFTAATGCVRVCVCVAVYMQLFNVQQMYANLGIQLHLSLFPLSLTLCVLHLLCLLQIFVLPFFSIIDFYLPLTLSCEAQTLQTSSLHTLPVMQLQHQWEKAK